jgi:hypothetical protein
MWSRFLKYFFFSFVLLFSVRVSGQFNDAGLWFSLNGEKKITPALSANLSQGFRLNENITEVGEFFTDAGITCKINKNLRFSANYRFINKRRKNDFYYQRNRFYFDLTIKKKFKPIMLIFRTRFEDEYRQIHKSTESPGPFYCSKNKLTVKLDLDKKFVPYIYIESSNPLNDPHGFFIDQMKSCGGIEYSINRVHSFDFFYLIQKDINVRNPETDFITGISYYYSF